jgi:hypothetical protein
MIFYLASRWGRKREMVQLSHYLRMLGQQVVSHWVWEPKMDQGADGNYVDNWNPDNDVAADIAERDIYAIQACTHLVLFTDRSRSGITGGRHVEFGIALAIPSKQTIVVGPRTNPFHYLATHHFEDTHAFMDWVRESTLNDRPDSQREALS